MSVSIEVKDLNYKYSAGTAFEQAGSERCELQGGGRGIYRPDRPHRIWKVYADPAFEWLIKARREIFSTMGRAYTGTAIP